MTELLIRKATLEEMNFFLLEAKEEGWNPGICDAIPFYKTDPEGFFIGLVGEKKVGCISAVAYNDAYGFIGFYIVLPDYRHYGIGHQLWKQGLKHLGQRIIGLDGVLEQQHNYEKSNFQLYYKNQRFEGNVVGKPSNDLLNLSEIPFKNLLQYDANVYGFERTVFLKNWIEMPNAYSLAKMENGKLVGYGVLRSCYKGYKIGPLFADNLDIATEIFQALCKETNGSSVFLDISDANPQALTIAQKFSLISNFQTVRMYTKKPPKQNLSKVYGITTFELG